MLNYYKIKLETFMMMVDLKIFISSSKPDNPLQLIDNPIQRNLSGKTIMRSRQSQKNCRPFSKNLDNSKSVAK